jgi:hypothetical protein
MEQMKRMPKSAQAGLKQKAMQVWDPPCLDRRVGVHVAAVDVAHTIPQCIVLIPLSVRGVGWVAWRRQALRRKRMYEQQREQTLKVSFNMEQVGCRAASCPLPPSFSRLLSPYIAFAPLRVVCSASCLRCARICGHFSR